jgi:hypothetical protein
VAPLWTNLVNGNISGANSSMSSSPRRRRRRLRRQLLRHGLAPAATAQFITTCFAANRGQPRLVGQRHDWDLNTTANGNGVTSASTSGNI